MLFRHLVHPHIAQGHHNPCGHEVQRERGDGALVPVQHHHDLQELLQGRPGREVHQGELCADLRAIGR